MPYYDRFDIIEAHYWFLIHHHQGQWSERYERLCGMSQYFTPSPLHDGPTSENAQAIYDNLCDREGCVHMRYTS
jgi:hypothetical protein